MTLSNSDFDRKQEIHEKLSRSEPLWYFKKLPDLTIDDIEFELTPESKELFARGKPDQGYLALGELMPDGKIKLHLLPTFDIKESNDPAVAGIGDRPEFVRLPTKPEDPTQEQQADEDFMEKYHAQMKEWQAKYQEWQEYLKADDEWMAKWKVWVENPQNFVDKDGIPYGRNQYVVTGDAKVKGNTGIGHKRMIRILGLTEKSGVQSELIGFGIWKGKICVMREFRDRSLSQNPNSVLWDDKLFKQYVDNGMEMYGIANRSILESLIDKLKLPAFIICALPAGKYIVEQNKRIVDCGTKVDKRIITRLTKGLVKEKNDLISYEKFSNLKTMVELSDESLKESNLPPFVELTEQQEVIKKEMLFYRVRSLPWALGEKMIGYLLKNLPDTPYTEGGDPLARELNKDNRSVSMTSPIFDLIKNGEIEEVQKWMEAGGSPNEIGCTQKAYDDPENLKENALSLIEVAFKNKQIKIFQYLFLHPRFDKEKYFSKMLLAALKEGFAEIVDFLLNDPFVPSKQDPNLVNALALDKGLSEEFILSLFKKGGMSLSYRDSYGRDLLMIALDMRDNEIVKKLLTKTEIDLTNTDSQGRSALIIALEKKADKEIILSMVKRKVINLSSTDKQGRNALIIALETAGTDKEIILRLINRGAINFSYLDDRGRNALMIALSKKADKEIIYALMSKKEIDLKQVTKLGKNALIIALAEKADPEIIKALLAREEIDLTQVDMHGRNALKVARENNADKMIIQEIEKRMEEIEERMNDKRRSKP